LRKKTRLSPIARWCCHHDNT